MIEQTSFSIEAKAKPTLNQIIDALKSKTTSLHLDTDDKEQLKPEARLISISNVLDACESEIGEYETVIDAGSGFGYGVVVFNTRRKKVVGVENVKHKIDQGNQLFAGVGVKIEELDSVDFTKSPAVVHKEMAEVSGEKADLISIFYVGLQMLMDQKVWEALDRLLKENGKILIATEASKDRVEELANGFDIPFKIKFLEIQDNFEKTAIILSRK